MSERDTVYISYKLYIVKSKEEAIPFVEGGAKEGGRERVNSGPNSLSYFPTGFQERN